MVKTCRFAFFLNDFFHGKCVCEKRISGQLGSTIYLPCFTFQYYNEYLKICKEHEDDLGIGKACQALAIANQRY